ncbi:DUF3526 domain-containing protein [Luteimonas sp. 3794]|uniref:ABC transporter permease n=1 Tax=Luteimonas sp. 3794 TaxID=2817730 RepID=UPI0028596E36|nr:DUF3526 domain-containing protein [Luteimonas sp. 3794]MDR6989956.1 ABC-2 type transport system permease protein [Luteimonas sp. 3794]
MNLWHYEWRLLLRARVAVAGLVLLTLLALASLMSGVQRMDSQRAAIERIPALQQTDLAAVIHAHGTSTDAGHAAYYTFHPTWHAPEPLAFAAVGMRDVAPYILRVRALGLEAQIHDGDTFNPELALAGRFDFAFLLTFLLPVFVIVLFHDLRSAEAEAGRERMLRALPHPLARIYARRAVVRGVALLACVVPLFVGFALHQGVAPGLIAAVVALTIGYTVFWIALALLVARRRWSSSTNAAALVTVWAAIALVLPALSHVAIERAIRVDQGAEIARAQREAVNAAWDMPRDLTMQRFYAKYPEWQDSALLGHAFHYKWYLAFHQNGDDSVAEQAAAYRRGIEQRADAAARVGWVLPPVGMQVLMTRWAGTDMRAHLAYQDRIRAYHARLRHFYYGYLFREVPFTADDYPRAPAFAPDHP